MSGVVFGEICMDFRLRGNDKGWRGMIGGIGPACAGMTMMGVREIAALRSQ